MAERKSKVKLTNRCCGNQKNGEKKWKIEKQGWNSYIKRERGRDAEEGGGIVSHLQLSCGCGSFVGRLERHVEHLAEEGHGELSSVLGIG